MKLFITGGTGFLGEAILSRIAKKNNFSKIILLVRAKKELSAFQRGRDLLNKIFSPEEIPLIEQKFHFVEGDITLPKFGLSENDYISLRESVDQILHLGASTDFGSPLDLARKNNVVSTENLIALGKDWQTQGVLKRIDYTSTAYVAGKTKGIVNETDLSRNQKFANTYEQSKYEAEVLVRKASSEVPFVIHRPSIVAGDSKTGYTPHFNVLYWPLKLLAKEIMPSFPCNRKGGLDIVPVDYVADSMTQILLDPNVIGRTFLITAGRGNEVRMGQLVEDFFKNTTVKRVPKIPFFVFDILYYTPMNRFLMPKVFNNVVDVAKPYEAYIRGTGVYYDNQMSKTYLESHGIFCPEWTKYGPVLMKYCMDSKWGKKAPKELYKVISKVAVA